MKHLKTINEFADYQNSKGDKFWGNLGAGVLVYNKTTKKFLISMRSSEVNEPNTFGIIGGKVDEEDDLNLKEEAKRELREETGYDGDIELTEISVFKSSNGSFEYHTFLGIIDDEFDPIPEPESEWETDYFCWITFEELIEDEDSILEPSFIGLPEERPYHFTYYIDSDEEDENGEPIKEPEYMPKHFGLKFTLKEAKNKILKLINF